MFRDASLVQPPPKKNPKKPPTNMGKKKGGGLSIKFRRIVQVSGGLVCRVLQNPPKTLSIQFSSGQPCSGQTTRPSGSEDQSSELNVRRKRLRRGQKRMTAEEALAVRRQRNRRAARATRGRQQESAAEETSSASGQASPGVRRVSLCLVVPDRYTRHSFYLVTELSFIITW